MSVSRSDPSRRDALDWSRDGSDWPNREASRFIDAGGLRWHVQVMGEGPVLLLLHGTGASTHSWRDLMPLLARQFTVVAPDLPGHAFSQMPQRDGMSLPGMAGEVAALLRALDLAPTLAVGHSAGAAVMIRMVLDRSMAPRGLIGLNAALVPIGGAAGQILSPLAKLISQNSLVPRLFAWRAGEGQMLSRLVDRTGSVLNEAGLDLYRRLVTNPAHAAAALTMMAEWDLWSFEESLPRLKTPLALIVGGKDGTVQPSDAFRIRDVLPATMVEYLRGLGHLAHEEQPERVAALILAHARRWAIVG